MSGDTADCEAVRTRGTMSRNGFHIGDRVAVYIGESRYVLKLSRFTESGCLLFDSKDNIGHMTYLAHPRQCRRLKTKKRREWWILKHGGNCPMADMVHLNRVASDKPLCGACGEAKYILVREVIAAQKNLNSLKE